MVNVVQMKGHQAEMIFFPRRKLSVLQYLLSLKFTKISWSSRFFKCTRAVWTRRRGESTALSSWVHTSLMIYTGPSTLMQAQRKLTSASTWSAV